MELARIVAGHPRLALALAISDKWAGSALGDHLPLPTSGRRPAGAPAARRGGGVVRRPRHRVPVHAGGGVAGASRRRRWRPAPRVVDLSGAFRLAANEYPRWYGFEHARPDLLAGGLLFDAGGGRVGRRRAARAWCRTRAATRPPRRWRRWRCCGARSSNAHGIVIDAKSGTTGAGRKANEDFSFSEVDGDFRAYRVLRHQHTPEIERALGLAGHKGVKVTFTPHLLPDAARDPGDGLRPPDSRQDRRRRRRRDRAVRGRAAVPARRQARRRPPARAWSGRTG